MRTIRMAGAAAAVGLLLAACDAGPVQFSGRVESKSFSPGTIVVVGRDGDPHFTVDVRSDAGDLEHVDTDVSTWDHLDEGDCVRVDRHARETIVKVACS